MTPAKRFLFSVTGFCNEAQGLAANRLVFCPSVKKVLLFAILFYGSMAARSQQVQHLQYAINHQGQKVGELVFQQKNENKKTTFEVESLVKIKMILSFTIQAWEHSVYEDDVLQSSSLLRHVNGKRKVSKQIRNNGSGLTVLNEGTEKKLQNVRVKYNMHSLYAIEPVSFTNVFSETHQRFIPIIKLATHHYKLSFPDGGSNEYFYKNGICQKVKVKSSLFNAEFVLATP
jgi:hypothetical protein